MVGWCVVCVWCFVCDMFEAETVVVVHTIYSVHVYQPVIIWTVVFTVLSKCDQSEGSVSHLDRKWLYIFVVYSLMASLVAQIE